MDRLNEYLHKAQIQRQIMSDRSRRFDKLSGIQNSFLVGVSGLITFFGFSGNEAVTKYVRFFYAGATADGAQLIFNLTAFVLFLLGILYLVFNFGGKQIEASRAVARLAAFSNELEDRLSRLEFAPMQNWELDAFRKQYSSIMESIPQNSDEEYLRAKKHFSEKQIERAKVSKEINFAFVPEEQELIVRTAVERSQKVMAVLTSLRDIGQNFYVGGGIIRSLVWDQLHGYKLETPSDDVDVIYFDQENCSKEHDQAIESQLYAVAPNIVWSVKNQARMHNNNNEDPYITLEEAINKWPETCTAILCRIDATGQIRFIAPFGFDDLVRLLVVPTPHFLERQSVIVHRIVSKGWIRQWPKLRLALSKESTELLESAGLR